MIFEDMENDRILETLLKSLSQTEKGLYKIVNYIVKISSRNLTNQCNCKKYYINLSSREYAEYKMNANSLKKLVNKSIAFKTFSEDLTGKPKCTLNLNFSQSTKDINNAEIFGTKLTQCSNINCFLKEANKITKLSSNPHKFVSQILTFLDLIGDLLISICSLKQPDTEVEILSGIYVADVFSLYEKYSSIWNELNRIVSDSENELKLIIHNNKCRKSKHLSFLFSELKEYISASLGEICKVKFYYNDFVVFMEGFKFKNCQDYLLRSAASSLTETQNQLSNKDLSEAQGDSRTRQDDSVFLESQLTNINDNNNKKDLTNINLGNDCDLVNFKLLENQIIPSEKTNNNEQCSHNQNSDYPENGSTTQFEHASKEVIYNEENADASYLYLYKFQNYLSFYDSLTDTKIQMLDIIEEGDENSVKTSNSNESNESENNISVLNKNINDDNQIKSIDTIFIKGFSSSEHFQNNKFHLDENKYSEIKKANECSKTLFKKESVTDGRYYDNTETMHEQSLKYIVSKGIDIGEDMYLLKKHRFENCNTVSCYDEGLAMIPIYKNVESKTNFASDNYVRKSVDVATQVILETVDISSQTITWSVSPSFSSVTSRLSIESGKCIDELSRVNNFVKQLTNCQDEIALNKFKNPLESKWPVNASYIPCTYNIKGKSQSYSPTKKYERKNQVTAYVPSGIKQSHTKGSQIVKNICRKYARPDLTKEYSKFIDFLNPQHIYSKTVPYSINSYEFGLSDTDSALLIHHIKSDYKKFPNDLNNIVESTVSLHYFNTKSTTDMNFESMISALTSSKVDRVRSNLLSIKNNTSNEFTKSFCAKSENEKNNIRRLFDKHGYPMTDVFGNVLKDPYGRNLVNISLLKTDNIVAYDALLNPSNSTAFNPFIQPLSNNIGIKLTVDGKNPLLLFDKYERPLTDSIGAILENNYGRTLLRFNKLGQPVSDYRGGQLYTVKGKLWTFRNEKECEVMERYVESEKNQDKRVDSELDKSKLKHGMDEMSVERIKAKIQEPLPIIDDIDLSLGTNIAKGIEESQIVKLVSMVENEDYNDLKSNNLKLDSANDIIEESQPTTEFFDSILSIDWGLRNLNKLQPDSNKSLSGVESGISITPSHKTVTYKTRRKICKSKTNIITYNVHSISRDSAVNRDTIKYHSDSTDDSNWKESNVGSKEMNCIKQYSISKYFSISDDQKPCFIGDEQQQRKSDYKLHKNLEHRHDKFIEPKQTRDKKTYEPNLKTRKKMESKCLRKDNQNTCRKCNKLYSIKHIYYGKDSNETKPSLFSACFHGPVQFIFRRLGATLLSNENVEVKRNKGKMFNKYVQKRKNHEKMEVNQRPYPKISVNKIIKTQQFKKPHQYKKTNSKIYENHPVYKQIGDDCLQDLYHGKTSSCDSKENPFYNHSLLSSALFDKYNLRTMDISSNTYRGYINKKNIPENRSNIEYLINKKTKSSIPSKILKSTRIIAAKKSKLLTPQTKQLSSIEKNNYFYHSLKNLNKRDFKLKEGQECTRQINTSKKNAFTIPHDKDKLDNFVNLQK